MKRILVTGGAGFIGSHFVDHLIGRGEDEVVVIDKLTYAGELRNLEASRGRIRFLEGDVCDPADLEAAFAGGIDRVVHFAAESHVDNSIDGPLVFARTNVLGTLRLLMYARERDVGRFLHVSTDEVYGSREAGFSREGDPHLPSSPYAATKSGAEQLARAYHVTHGLPVLITRSSNCYGPRQHPEKFVAKVILNALCGRPIPVYGNGANRRDWLHVRDNCRAIDLVLREGRPGRVYNVASGCSLSNLELARRLLRTAGASEDLIEFVEDRRGHDFRYALDTRRIEALGWRPREALESGLKETVEWYRARDSA